MAFVAGEGDSESMALVPLDGEGEDAILSISDFESYGSESSVPSTDAMELAESILQRLKPGDRHEMGQLKRTYKNRHTHRSLISVTGVP